MAPGKARSSRWGRAASTNAAGQHDLEVALLAWQMRLQCELKQVGIELVVMQMEKENEDG
jgi:hypothetical protein